MAEKETAEGAKGEQVVTPWVAKAGEGQSKIDYDKLISKHRAICTLCVHWFCTQSSLGVCGLMKASWEGLKPSPSKNHTTSLGEGFSSRTGINS